MRKDKVKRVEEDLHTCLRESDMRIVRGVAMK